MEEMVAAILTLASHVAKPKPDPAYVKSGLATLGEDWKHVVDEYQLILKELQARAKPSPETEPWTLGGSNR